MRKIYQHAYDLLARWHFASVLESWLFANCIDFIGVPVTYAISGVIFSMDANKRRKMLVFFIHCLTGLEK